MTLNQRDMTQSVTSALRDKHSAEIAAAVIFASSVGVPEACLCHHRVVGVLQHSAHQGEEEEVVNLRRPTALTGSHQDC